MATASLIKQQGDIPKEATAAFFHIASGSVSLTICSALKRTTYQTEPTPPSSHSLHGHNCHGLAAGEEEIAHIDCWSPGPVTVHGARTDWHTVTLELTGEKPQVPQQQSQSVSLRDLIARTRHEVLPVLNLALNSCILSQEVGPSKALVGREAE
jgi:hypothetical protein